MLASGFGRYVCAFGLEMRRAQAVSEIPIPNPGPKGTRVRLLYQTGHVRLWLKVKIVFIGKLRKKLAI